MGESSPYQGVRGSGRDVQTVEKKKKSYSKSGWLKEAPESEWEMNDRRRGGTSEEKTTSLRNC